MRDREEEGNEVLVEERYVGEENKYILCICHVKWPNTPNIMIHSWCTIVATLYVNTLHIKYMYMYP